MGRYFGISNATKKQNVSSYWKGDEWCNCHQVMHQFHWDINNVIRSACYDTVCEFKYDDVNDTMIVNDITDEMFNEDPYEENDKQNFEEEMFSEENMNNEDSYEENKNEKSSDIAISTCHKDYGFDQKFCDEMFDHVPIWKDNVCTKCNFVYDDALLEKYEKKFDGIFFMN